MLDLQGFLRQHEAHLLRIREPIAVRHAVTALQHLLWRRKQFPILLIERPQLAGGAVSRHAAVTNLTASREITARALGLHDHRRAAHELAEKMQSPLEPVTVARGDAPVKAMILRGDAASIEHLPVFTQHEADAGPYLSAAHATTCDPDTGIDNTAIQRVWVKSRTTFGYFPYPASHNRQNILKFWARGEPAPVAFWIGHHPAVSIGAQAKLDYPESHWGAAGALAGEPVRLVATELFGDNLKVPADAEIVLEGFVPPNRLEPEGPFGEYTGFTGEATMSPVFELHCVTQRSDAVYHDYGSGLPDALVPDNMVLEAKLLRIARQTTAEARNVYVPVSGRRFHAYVQLGEVAPETRRRLLRALLEFRRVKHVVLVNDDIDLFDEEQVMWAVATRTQMDRDALIIGGLPGSMLDPSLSPGESNTAKMGIDATWKGHARPARNRVPDDVLKAIELE
jgi:2,5-furandicarboxylate decarboxylase 1